MDSLVGSGERDPRVRWPIDSEVSSPSKERRWNANRAVASGCEVGPAQGVEDVLQSARFTPSLDAKFKIPKLSHRMKILHAWSIKSK